MKYRVVEETMDNGDKIYKPQKKRFFFWSNFLIYDIGCTSILARKSLKEAWEFIEKQEEIRKSKVVKSKRVIDKYEQK